jgi:hypothetical protein
VHTEVKCDRHVGDAHAPRCNACESLAGEYRQLGLLDVKPGMWVGHRPRAVAKEAARD